jgi:hypothetical protein
VACTGYIGCPFQKRTSIMALRFFFFGLYAPVGGVKISCMTVSFLILEWIC